MKADLPHAFDLTAAPPQLVSIERVPEPELTSDASMVRVAGVHRPDPQIIGATPVAA